MTTAIFPAAPEFHAGSDAVRPDGRRAVAARPLAAVTGAEIQAPLITGGHARYANLDYGASAPALSVVSAYLNEILPYYASVHRGAGYASQISTSVYENARDIVRDFVGGRADDSVIFTRNTTDSLNLLAGCLPLRDGRPVGEVLYLDIEHHANLLPWQNVPHRSVVAAPTLAATVDRLRDELSRGGVSLLAVTGASNVTGEILPIRALAALAHEYGARIVVDAAQLAPHRRIDIAADDVDYLAFSGHKLYAPFGVRRAGRAAGLARRRHPAPGRRRRRPRCQARLRQLDHRTCPARGRLAERPGCGRPGPRHPGDRSPGPGAVAGPRGRHPVLPCRGPESIEGVTVHRIFADSATGRSGPAPSAS